MVLEEWTFHYSLVWGQGWPKKKKSWKKLVQLKLAQHLVFSQNETRTVSNTEIGTVSQNYFLTQVLGQFFTMQSELFRTQKSNKIRTVSNTGTKPVSSTEIEFDNEIRTIWNTKLGSQFLTLKWRRVMTFNSQGSLSGKKHTIRFSVIKLVWTAKQSKQKTAHGANSLQ